MSVEWGILAGVLSLIIAYQGYQLNKNKDVKSDSKNTAEMKAELGYIRKGVDDIRIDQKANEKNIAHLSERVTRVEESTKQAHKRIDQKLGNE